MKEYINNLNLYPTIKEYGKEFSYSLNILGTTQTAGTVPLTDGFANIPLFCPSMLESLYSDVTEKIAVSLDGSGNQFGLSSYGSLIWSGNTIDAAGLIGQLYPYNRTVTNNVNISSFSMVFGTGLNSVGTVGGWGTIGLNSMNMQYVNLLNRLKVQNLLCTNINIKIYNPLANFKFNNLPLYFFHQSIDSSIYSYDTTVGRYVNPLTNASTRITAGSIKSVTEVDIPCSWIFGNESGMTIPFAYDWLLNQGILVTYTFKQIK